MFNQEKYGVPDQVSVKNNMLGPFRLGSSTNTPAVNWFGSYLTSAPVVMQLLSGLEPTHLRVQNVTPPQLTSSTWDFTYLDDVLQPVLTDGTMNPELQLAAAPSFMYSSPGIFSDTTYASFATYSAQVVKYYNTGGFTDSGSVRHVSPSTIPVRWWGVYNEPEYIYMTPDEYVSLYNATASAMIAADPTIRLVGLELGSDNQNAAYAATFINSLTQPVHALAIHAYPPGPGNTDAALFSSVPDFGARVSGMKFVAQASPLTAQTQLWVTENNIDGGSNVGDPRGADAFFAAWKPYVYSQVGKAGATMLHEWYFAGAPQYGEIYGSTNSPALSYWVDYWLNRYFPTSASLQRLEISETDGDNIETLATENPDTSITVMIVNHTLANSDDTDGAGALRTVTLDVSALGDFSSANELVIDGSTNVSTGPTVTSIPVQSTMTINLNGYGVTFLNFNRSVTNNSAKDLNVSWAPQWNFLAALWHFNALPGTVASQTLVDDSSGQASDGKLTDTGAVYGAGKVNQGITLDGNEWVTIPAAQAPNPCQSMTIAFWMKSTTPDTINALLFKGDYGVLGWYLSGASSSSLSMRIDTSAATNQIIAWAGGITPFDGSWHHVAVTLNSGAWATYYDGQPSNGGTYSAGNGFCNASQPLYMGANYVGSFDETAIWYKALTAAEVQQIYSVQSN